MNDEETQRDKEIRFKEPGAMFKKGMPGGEARGGKKRGKVKLIADPIALTTSEMCIYEYWLNTMGAMEALYQEPKDEAGKETLREFMVLYAKIKAAMQAVEENKTHVSLGKSKLTGREIEIGRGWYETTEDEANFVSSLYQALVSCKAGKNAMMATVARHEGIEAQMRSTIEGLERAREKYRELVQKLVEDLSKAKKELIQCKKELAVKRDPLARSQGRLQSKRAKRVKTVPVKFAGKRRK